MSSELATDVDVFKLTASEAVALMREALVDHHKGSLHSPVRFGVQLGTGSFTFTAGRLDGQVSGFRLGSSNSGQPTELTVVLDDAGELLGVVVGREVGRRRTGALGGAAAQACARPDAATLGLLGAGQQAFTQLWAIAAVRSLRRVRVWSRTPSAGKRFAARAARELDLSVEVVADPYLAAHDTDIVVLATPAQAPLIEAAWLSAGTHLHTLGPKGSDEGECPVEVVRRADLLVSDSPEQLLAMEGPDQPWTKRRPAVALGSVVAGSEQGRRRAEDLTCYASVGLAGTEVLLARRVLEL